VAVIPFQSFGDSSDRDVVDRHMQAMSAEPSCILLHLPFRLAAVSCTLQWTSEADINKQLQLLFAKTLPLNNYITVASCHVKLALIFEEIHKEN